MVPQLSVRQEPVQGIPIMINILYRLCFSFKKPNASSMRTPKPTNTDRNMYCNSVYQQPAIHNRLHEIQDTCRDTVHKLTYNDLTNRFTRKPVFMTRPRGSIRFSKLQIWIPEILNYSCIKHKGADQTARMRRPILHHCSHK